MLLQKSAESNPPKFVCVLRRTVCLACAVANQPIIGSNITTIGDALPHIVPVELNAYLLRVETHLARFHNETAAAAAAAAHLASTLSTTTNTTSRSGFNDARSHAEKSATYHQAAMARATAMDALMWNESSRHWNDLYFDWPPQGNDTDGQDGDNDEEIGNIDGWRRFAMPAHTTSTTPMLPAQQLVRPFHSSSSFLPLWAGGLLAWVSSCRGVRIRELLMCTA